MTETIKHTPGPWHIADDGWFTEVYGADGYQIVDAGQGPHLLETHDGNEGHWATTPGAYVEREELEERANACLIAAAPDLLAMLKVAQLWLDVDGRFDMQGINAAIAKAEGRP
jgi:hypothetical protein